MSIASTASGNYRGRIAAPKGSSPVTMRIYIPQTSNHPPGHRRLRPTQAAHPLYLHAYMACFKNKTDTNPFAAVAYFPDFESDLARRGNTQDFVTLQQPRGFSST
jgi:hypothetical protein